MESTEELKQSQYVDWHLLKLPSEWTKTKVKDFEVWKAKIKGMLNKVKSSKLEQIKGTAKLKEADQHIVDAFLIVLGHKTKEDRKQALKDFRASKIDLLKQTKFVKFEDFTFEDCKQIQNLLADFINNKTESIADLYKDLAKWVVNLVYIKIATARVQMRSDFIKREGIADLKLSDENIDELRYDYTLDWSVIGYIEYKGSYYESSEHHDLKDDIDFSTKRPPEEVINFYNFLLELYGKNADQSWDDTTSFTTHTKTIDECLVEDSIFNLQKMSKIHKINFIKTWVSPNNLQLFFWIFYHK